MALGVAAEYPERISQLPATWVHERQSAVSQQRAAQAEGSAMAAVARSVPPLVRAVRCCSAPGPVVEQLPTSPRLEAAAHFCVWGWDSSSGIPGTTSTSISNGSNGRPSAFLIAHCGKMLAAVYSTTQRLAPPQKGPFVLHDTVPLCASSFTSVTLAPWVLPLCAKLKSSVWPPSQHVVQFLVGAKTNGADPPSNATVTSQSWAP